MVKRIEPTRRTNSPAIPRQVVSSELDRLARTVEKHDRPGVARQMGVRAYGGSFDIVNQRPWNGWAKITGTDGAGVYSWVELYDDGAGAFATQTEGRSGTTAVNVAREVNGNPDVPTGAVVMVWIQYDHEGYWFDYNQGLSLWYLDVDIFAEYDVTFDVDVTFEGGVTINKGTWIFPSTDDADVAPDAKLVLPTLTVPGPPEWPGTYGEIVCGGPYLYQSDGLDWYPYVPWSPYAQFPPEEGGITYTDEDGYFRNDPDYFNYDDGTKTLYIKQPDTIIDDSWRIENKDGDKVVWVNGDKLQFPTTNNPLVAPNGRLIIPVLLVPGPPDWVGIIGEIVCDGPCLYQYDGTQWVAYCEDDGCCPDGEIGTIQAVTAVECVNGVLQVTTTDFDFVYEDCCLTIVEDEPVVTEAGCCDCGTIVTECCPDRLLPATLYATLESACACFDYTVELTWDADNSRWESEFYDDPCSPDNTAVFLWCDAGTWKIEKLTSAECSIDATAATSAACDPGEAVAIVFDAEVSTGTPCTDCAQATAVTITITETAP